MGRMGKEEKEKQKNRHMSPKSNATFLLATRQGTPLVGDRRKGKVRGGGGIKKGTLRDQEVWTKFHLF